MLPEEASDPDAMAQRLASLPDRPLPNDMGAAGMLNGLGSISTWVGKWAGNRPTADLYAIAGAG